MSASRRRLSARLHIAAPFFARNPTETHMKRKTRTLLWASIALLAIVLAACGGRETMASKSAAAYRDAEAKGVPITADDHGGHAVAETATSESHAGMDHGAMNDSAGHSGMSAADHAAMGHTSSPTMDHAAMGHGASAAQHAGHNMGATMDHPGHTTASPMDHAAMGHGATPPPTSVATGPHAGHAMEGDAPVAPSVTIRPPTSSAEIAKTEPAATLRPDPFDAPVPVSVSEAQKATTAPAHSGHSMNHE
jgi:hypothetical protein